MSTKGPSTKNSKNNKNKSKGKDNRANFSIERIKNI